MPDSIIVYAGPPGYASVTVTNRKFCPVYGSGKASPQAHEAWFRYQESITHDAVKGQSDRKKIASAITTGLVCERLKGLADDYRDSLLEFSWDDFKQWCARFGLRMPSR